MAKKPFTFRGVASPNTTQVPDQFFDELLPVVSGAELKVLLYITRRTFGFKRASDTISLSQLLTGITTKDGHVLDHGTGLSKPTLLAALRHLSAMHVIRPERRHSLEHGDEPTSYSLHFAAADESIDGEGKKRNQGGGKDSLPRGWSKNFTTQETGEQETGRQQTVSSNMQYSKGDTVQSPPVPIVENVPGTDDRRSLEPAPRPPSSERIEVVVRELSAEFGDTAHTRANCTQTLRLLADTGLTDSAFEHELYQARSIVRDEVNRRRRLPDATPIARPMAFLFTVLRRALNREGEAR